MVHRDELPLLAQEERKVSIPTKSATRRLDNEAGEGHDRIDRISPRLGHPRAGLGLARVSARDDAVLWSRLPLHGSTPSVIGVWSRRSSSTGM
jgi:hypothetical protein